MSIVDAQGEVVASYNYDPYGRIVASSGTLAKINPLRYRGYVYDDETGLYYLQSRYYDPALGRFINADNTDYLGADSNLTSYNLFVYCKNNPVLYLDELGTSAMIPPLVENGLNLPVSGGLPVVINGTTYYYAVNYNSSGELYEYWFDSNGNLVRARHHSTHGNEKEHENPHDHEGTKGRNDKNSIKKKRLPVDDNFKSPLESADVQKNDNAEIIGNAAAGIIIGVAVYQIVKWSVASVLAAATGGASYLIASMV